MAQSAVTVTPPNPTPPTNMTAGLANTGPTTPPPSLAFADTVWSSDPYHPGRAPNTIPPYLDDGVATSSLVFGAPNSGTASEGAGSELSVTAPGSRAECPTIAVSCLGSFTGVANSPNASHASSLSPAAATTLTSITPGSTVSGVGTTTLGATGTNFTRQSVIYVNGVAQTTTYTSATSINAAAVTKKLSAGPWPVTVVTAGAVTTAPQTWTFS